MGQLGVGVAMKLKDVRRPVPVEERVGIVFPRYFTSRLEAGKMTLDRAALDLRATIQEIIGLLSAQASAKHLVIAMRYAPDAPAAVVGDATRIRQVLTNLLGNAIKFTERGSVEVSVQCRERTAHEAWMLIAVHDTGIGIPEDKLDLIFEKFTQADGSMTRRYGGTGLGLAIVKQLVELMGGSIRVESRVGAGSTFTVQLCMPLVAAPEPLEEQLTAKETRS